MGLLEPQQYKKWKKSGEVEDSPRIHFCVAEEYGFSNGTHHVMYKNVSVDSLSKEMGRVYRNLMSLCDMQNRKLMVGRSTEIIYF